LPCSSYERVEPVKSTGFNASLCKIVGWKSISIHRETVFQAVFHSSVTERVRLVDFSSDLSGVSSWEAEPCDLAYRIAPFDKRLPLNFSTVGMIRLIKSDRLRLAFCPIVLATTARD
jgi:hypothetical protein